MSIEQPHDGLVRNVFGVPAHAIALIQANLPKCTHGLLDWPTLARQNSSFIRPNFDQTHGDLLFSIQTRRKQSLFIYIFIEHQSQTDPLKPLRMLDTLCQIWRYYVKTHPKQSLPRPLVLPIVVSPAANGWNTHQSFRALFDADQIADFEREKPCAFVPDFAFLL